MNTKWDSFDLFPVEVAETFIIVVAAEEIIRTFLDTIDKCNIICIIITMIKCLCKIKTIQITTNNMLNLRVLSTGMEYYYFQYLIILYVITCYHWDIENIFYIILICVKIEISL